MVRRVELNRDERAPAAARETVEDLRPVLGDSAVEDARLLLSEVVTNSVLHGEGETITVLLDSGRPGLLRCEVIDDGNGFVPRGRGGRSVGGWGLELVDRLAVSWGVETGSTHVWFELPARQAHR